MSNQYSIVYRVLFRAAYGGGTEGWLTINAHLTQTVDGPIRAIKLISTINGRVFDELSTLECDITVENQFEDNPLLRNLLTIEIDKIVGAVATIVQSHYRLRGWDTQIDFYQSDIIAVLGFLIRHAIFEEWCGLNDPTTTELCHNDSITVTSFRSSYSEEDVFYQLNILGDEIVGRDVIDLMQLTENLMRNKYRYGHAGNHCQFQNKYRAEEAIINYGPQGVPFYKQVNKGLKAMVLDIYETYKLGQF